MAMGRGRSWEGLVYLTMSCILTRRVGVSGMGTNMSVPNRCRSVMSNRANPKNASSATKRAECSTTASPMMKQRRHLGTACTVSPSSSFIQSPTYKPQLTHPLTRLVCPRRHRLPRHPMRLAPLARSHPTQSTTLPHHPRRNPNFRDHRHARVSAHRSPPWRYPHHSYGLRALAQLRHFGGTCRHAS